MEKSQHEKIVYTCYEFVSSDCFAIVKKFETESYHEAQAWIDELPACRVWVVEEEADETA